MSETKNELKPGARAAWAVVGLVLGITALMLICAIIAQMSINEMEFVDAEISYGDALRGCLLLWVGGRLFNWGNG